MRASLVLQTVGALIAIILGVLFFVYLPHDLGDVTTDAFFVGAGVLLLRSTYNASRRPLPSAKTKTGTARQGRKQQKKK